MSLDLSTLKFSVNTEELEQAVKKIEKLGESVQGLATSIGKLDKEASDANKTQSQTNLNNAKTEALNIKNAKSIRDAAAANEELTAATKKRQSVEERQTAITRNMADGYSRGQASILATAEAAGEATDRIGELLKTQRAMSGQSPFDKTLGAATVFANELRVLTVANDLYNQDLGFTKNQLMELGREHVRMTEQFKIQGKSLAGLDAEFNSVVQSAQKVTQAENTMASSMKNADKATMDAGKANAYIENELQKVRFALQANNEELNRSTSNSLVRFENALKKSGLTLDQQKVKIDEYRKAQVELQKTTSSNQTDYITRAVGPQITDIIVGLSTGQSPLTVMMQQGGQLRDQFGMMGIAAKDMGDVMRNAMKGMAQSVFDTGKAIGSMLVGGIYDAGKAVVNFGLEVTRINSVMDYFKQKIAAQGEEGFKYIGMLNRAGAVVTGVFAVGIAAGVLSVLALGVAFVQVTKAQDDLTKSLVSSGAQLGLSNTEIIGLAESLGNVGATSVEILTAFKQMTESGNISRESLVAVAEAALLLESAGGKAASKTIEMFAKLADKPMETLSEYAQKTGLVDQAEIARIETLVKLGNEITATEEATKILSKATEDEAAIMLASLSDVSRLWLTVKGGISNAWRAVQEFAGSTEIMSGVKVVLQTVAVVATEVWYGIKGIGESLGGLGAIAAAVMTDIKNLDTNFTASKGMLGLIEQQDKARAVSYKDSIARIMQEGKYSREELNKTAAIAATGRKANADAEKDRVAHELAMKPWKEQEQKSLADNLTKQEFIKQAIDKTNKALTEGKTLRAEEIAQITKLAGADWDKSNKPKKAKLSDEQKKENKALEDYIDLMNKAVGLNKDYNNILDGLQLRRKNGKLTEEEYVKAVEELIKQQKFYTDGLAQEEKAQKAAQKAAADHMKLVEEFTKIQDEFTATSLKNLEGIQQENSALSLRANLLGKTEEEQKKINESYKVQGEISKINAKYDKERLELQQKYLKLQADGFDVDYDVWNKQIQQSVQQQGEEAKLVWAGVAMSAAESMQKEFDAIKSSITDVIVTALFDGGKAGSKKLRDTLVSELRNKVTLYVDAVVNTALSGGMNAMGFGGGSGGTSGSSSGFNFLSPNSISEGFTRFAGSSFGGSLGLSTPGIDTLGDGLAGPAQLTGLGTQVQSLASSAGSILSYASALNSLSEGKIGTAAGTALGQYFGGPIGAFIGGKIGSALDEAFAGETRSGASYTSANGKAVFEKGPSGGEIAGYQSRLMLENAQKAITETLKTVGSKASLTGFVAGLESSDKEKGFSYAGGQVGGKSFGESLGRDGGQFDMVSQDAQTAFANYGKQLSQSILEALQVTEDIPKSLKAMFDGIDISALTSEETDALLKTVNDLVNTVSQFNEAMLELPFEYLMNLSFDTAAGLIAAAGGMAKFGSNLSGFYDNFYTETEKTAYLTATTSKAFADLNIVMPAINESTRDWYRSEVERLGAMDLSIESNAKAYSSVLSLQGAVNALAPTFDDVARSVAEAIEKMAESVRTAEDVSVQMGMTTAYALAQSRAETAYSKALKNAPGLAGYTQEEIVRYAVKGDRTELDKETWGVIDELVGAIGDWRQAQATERERLTPKDSSPKDVAEVIDKSIQATIDYNLAIAEATNNTEDYARLQREAANATKLANGWTQVQIDTLNTAVDLSVELKKQKEALDLITQATSDYSIAMADATGNTEESARLQREVANATKLANGWTQVQIDTLNKAVDAAQSLSNLNTGLKSLESARTAVVSAFKAIEDAANNTQAAVNSAKEAITQGYVNAVEQQTQAQEVINDLIRQAAVEMAGFAGSIRDFLLQMSTTDIGADSKLTQLGALIEDFNASASKAKGGDTKAYGSITGKASSLLTAGKDQFSTAIEFARFSSNIGNTLAELATIADGKAGPLAEAVDPMVKAQADLLKANQEVAKWTLAVSESGAATSLTVADYAQDWRNANSANIKAQADLLAAQLLTKDINKQLVTVLGDLAALISVYNTANAAVPVYGGSATVNPIGSGKSGFGGEIKTIQDLYSVNLGREGDIAGMEFWSKAFLGDGVISAEERQQFAIAAMPEYLSKLNSFDVGTNSVPTDMYASLHKGERIIPAADNQELMQRLSSPMNSDNSELVKEIQYLNNRLAIIESNTASTAGHAAKTARLLDRAMPDGDAIATREATAI